MTARVWTVDELKRVHPLERARWVLRPDGRPAAEFGDEGWSVWVDDFGELCSWAGVHRADPPADVALAVILASQGLDSREAMADAVAGWQEAVDETRALRDGIHMERLEGQSDAWEQAEAMLRRGTVSP